MFNGGKNLPVSIHDILEKNKRVERMNLLCVITKLKLNPQQHMYKHDQMAFPMYQIERDGWFS